MRRYVICQLLGPIVGCFLCLAAFARDKPVKLDGGVAVRIADAPEPSCIYAPTDKVWLTLYRIVETKNHGFFSTENQAEIVTTVNVHSDPQSQKALSFPLSVKVNTRPYSSGQVYLPVEYLLVSGLPLTQQDSGGKNIVYTGFDVDTAIVNIRSAGGVGSAISALTTVTGSNKLSIPVDPYSQAASYLLDFANTSIKNDIDSKNADDKYTGTSLTLPFVTSTPTQQPTCPKGFETTGTKAWLMADGLRGDDYVPIDKTDEYCWTADIIPSFSLKAAKMMPGKACTDPSYAAQYKQVTNNFIAYYLQKQPVSSGHLGAAKSRELIKDKQESQRLCRVLGVKSCPAAN